MDNDTLTYTQIIARLIAKLEQNAQKLKDAMHFIQNKQASQNANFASEAITKSRLYLIKTLSLEELNDVETQVKDPNAVV